MASTSKQPSHAKRRWELLLLPVAALEIFMGLVIAAIGAYVLPASFGYGLAVIAAGALGVALPGVLLLLRSRIRYWAHLPILFLFLGSWIRSLFHP